MGYRSCLAPDCFNKREKASENGLFFYALPKEGKLLKKWLVNLRIDKVPHLPSKNYFICCKHFEADCFERNFKAELMGEKCKPPLIKGAVPTLFKHNNFQGKDAKRRVFSEERRRKKDKEEMLKDMLGPYHDMKLIPPDLITEVNENECPGEFSIQSLLPNFTFALESEGPTDHDYARKPTDDTSNHSLEEPSINGKESHQTSNSDRNQTAVDDSINTSRDGPSIDNGVNYRTHTDNEEPSSSHYYNRLKTYDKSRTTAVTNSVTSQFKSSISQRIKHGRLTDISCQTVNKPTTEISCQIKPCLVSVETQWDEKDFLPDPEIVEKDHAYCKKMRVEVDTIEIRTDTVTRRRKKRKRKY